ncbi:MAG: hypothetical protein ACREV9_04225 [Burkholderiales bacterium]
MKPAIFSWTFVGLFALAISFAGGLSYWWAVSVVVVAMILNGILAEIEDRLAAKAGALLKRQR